MKPANMIEAKSVSCLIIPIGETNLLLPNVTVAEILPWRTVKKWDAAPQWCIGLLNWRGETVPVIRYEKINGAKDTAQDGQCLLIMNRTQADSVRKFYGLAVDGLPRLIRLGNGDLKNCTNSLRVADAVHLQIGLETATVPRLSYLEEQIGSLAEY